MHLWLRNNFYLVPPFHPSNHTRIHIDNGSKIHPKAKDKIPIKCNAIIVQSQIDCSTSITQIIYWLWLCQLTFINASFYILEINRFLAFWIFSFQEFVHAIHTKTIFTTSFNPVLSIEWNPSPILRARFIDCESWAYMLAFWTRTCRECVGFCFWYSFWIAIYTLLLD